MMRAPIAAISKMGKAARLKEGREGWVMATRQPPRRREPVVGRLESGPKETHIWYIYLRVRVGSRFLTTDY